MKGHVSKLMDAWINEWMNEWSNTWLRKEWINE